MQYKKNLTKNGALLKVSSYRKILQTLCCPVYVFICVYSSFCSFVWKLSAKLKLLFRWLDSTGQWPEYTDWEREFLKFMINVSDEKYRVCRGSNRWRSVWHMSESDTLSNWVTGSLTVCILIIKDHKRI